MTASSKRRLRCWLVPAAILALFPAPALAQTGGRTDEVGVGGSVRTIGAVAQGPGVGSDLSSSGTSGFSQTLLRLTAELRRKDRFSFEFHLVQSHTWSPFSTGSPSGVFGLAAGETRYRALDATADWYRSDRQAASLWLDRLNVKVAMPRADVTIGRQAVTFGKAYFWNPLDEFLPFDARQFDREYKAGVDAMRIDIPLGRFSGVNVVAALGRALTPLGTESRWDRTADASWYGSALLVRYFGTPRGWDTAVQAGKVYGGYQLGAGVTGEIKRLEVRGEAAYLRAARSPSGRLVESHLTAVVGIGKRFDNSLWLEMEHLHNGAGSVGNLDDALARFAGGASLSLGREITGVTLSYDLLPLLVGQVAVLHSWSDGSSQLQPMLTYSTTNNTELLTGVSAGLGARPRPADPGVQLRSEFGSFPRLFFAEFKVYF